MNVAPKVSSYESVQHSQVWSRKQSFRAGLQSQRPAVSRRALGVHNTSCDIYNLVEQPKFTKLSSRFSSNRQAGPATDRDKLLAEAVDKIKV